MQSITALAHLRATVLYLVDVSEQCGYSLETQLALFKSIKPLFSNEPLVMVANKVDVKKIADLSPETQTMLQNFIAENNVDLIETSTLTEEGITLVKEKACAKLLAQRVEQKIKSKNVDGLMNRLHVAVPRPRDNKTREASIPQSVLERKAAKFQAMADTAEAAPADINITFGGPMSTDVDPDWDPQAYDTEDLRDKYLLKNPEWRYDNIPEIVDGMNIADYYDPDIEELLDRLEREEVEQLEEFENEMQDTEDISLTEEERALLKEVQQAKAIIINESRLKHTNTAPLPRTSVAERGRVGELEQHLTDMGIDAAKAVSRARSNSRGRSAGRVEREASLSASKILGQKRKREVEFSPGEGLRDAKQKKVAILKGVKEQHKIGKQGRKADSDRHIVVKAPKHLLTGKRGIGKTDRR